MVKMSLGLLAVLVSVSAQAVPVGSWSGEGIWFELSGQSSRVSMSTTWSADAITHTRTDANGTLEFSYEIVNDTGSSFELVAADESTGRGVCSGDVCFYQLNNAAENYELFVFEKGEGGSLFVRGGGLFILNDPASSGTWLAELQPVESED